MLKHVNWISALIILSITLLPEVAAVRADEDARETVLAAFETINALDGYHLTIKSNNLSKIIQTDGATTNTYTLQIVEGDIGQDGDRRFTRQFQSGDTYENMVKSQPLVMEQVVSDGKNYVNFLTEDTIYADMLNIEPGWWEYEHLLDASENTNITAFIRQFGVTETPLESVFHDNTVLDAHERASQVIDGVTLRVFDVELDAVQLLLEQSGITDKEQQQTKLTQDEGLLAASEITAKFRLWIGAQDGLLYRGKGEQRSFVPYGTAGTDSDPDYDFDSSGTTEIVISQHGEPVDIQPPDPALLNE
ncbi:MAG: hypothetical protein ABI690_25135 [Chloroflexota bacterium]